LTQTIKIHHHQQEWIHQVVKIIKMKVKSMVTIMDGALIKREKQGDEAQDEAPQVEDDDDGPIQRQSQAPHPRVHQMVQRDHPVDNILGSIQRG
jgi:hypothetical protein